MTKLSTKDSFSTSGVKGKNKIRIFFIFDFFT